MSSASAFSLDQSENYRLVKSHFVVCKCFKLKVLDFDVWLTVISLSFIYRRYLETTLIYYTAIFVPGVRKFTIHLMSFSSSYFCNSLINNLIYCFEFACKRSLNDAILTLYPKCSTLTH